MIDRTRENLAYAYRIMAKLKYDDHTYTHLSARNPNSQNYYIYPFGYRFDEVTPNSLLNVTLDGEILSGDEYQYNKTGYIIHGSIYEQRKDINAIYHLHTISTVAVSAMKEGLMPISQWALHFYDKISYYNYDSLALNKNTQGSDLVNALGNNKVMFLRNHGYIACGATPWEALFYCYHLENACRTQISALSLGRELIIPNKSICKKTNQDLLNFEKDLGKRDWNAWIRLIDKN